MSNNVDLTSSARKKALFGKERCSVATITVSFVDDAAMQKLNRKFRKKNYPTDVLSFNMDEKTDSDTYLLGEVVVNISQAERQASDYGNDPEHEVAELVEHGVLHLLGIDHSEKEGSDEEGN